MEQKKIKTTNMPGQASRHSFRQQKNWGQTTVGSATDVTGKFNQPPTGFLQNKTAAQCPKSFTGNRQVLDGSQNLQNTREMNFTVMHGNSIPENPRVFIPSAQPRLPEGFYPSAHMLSMPPPPLPFMQGMPPPNFQPFSHVPMQLSSVPQKYQTSSHSHSSTASHQYVPPHYNPHEISTGNMNYINKQYQNNEKLAKNCLAPSGTPTGTNQSSNSSASKLCNKAVDNENKEDSANNDPTNFLDDQEYPPLVRSSAAVRPTILDVPARKNLVKSYSVDSNTDDDEAYAEGSELISLGSASSDSGCISDETCSEPEEKSFTDIVRKMEKEMDIKSVKRAPEAVRNVTEMATKEEEEENADDSKSLPKSPSSETSDDVTSSRENKSHTAESQATSVPTATSTQVKSKSRQPLEKIPERFRILLKEAAAQALEQRLRLEGAPLFLSASAPPALPLNLFPYPAESIVASSPALPPSYCVMNPTTCPDAGNSLAYVMIPTTTAQPQVLEPSSAALDNSNYATPVDQNTSGEYILCYSEGTPYAAGYTSNPQDIGYQPSLVPVYIQTVPGEPMCDTQQVAYEYQQSYQMYVPYQAADSYTDNSYIQYNVPQYPCQMSDVVYPCAYVLENQTPVESAA